MRTTPSLARHQATFALWGGLTAYVGALVAVGLGTTGIVSIPLTSFVVIMLGWGLRGEVALLQFGILPGFATIGWLVSPLGMMAWFLDHPGLLTVVGLMAALLPLFLMRRVPGGAWMARLHQTLFAAPTNAVFRTLVEEAVERVRDAHPTPLPGGYALTVRTKPSILRVNGLTIEITADIPSRLNKTDIHTFLLLLHDAVEAELGQRAWPTEAVRLEVAHDSAHQTMARAARRAQTHRSVGFAEGDGVAAA